MSPGGQKVLLGVTGGIAAFKAVLLLRLLTRAGAEVKVVMTRGATRFVTPLTFEALSGHPVDVDLWSATHRGGENHVKLAQWAQALVVAPATADFLARAAQGRGDDLLAAVYLSAACPVVVAPAMHSNMWAQPAVQRNVATLAGDGVWVVPPEEGDLATGQGMGRMAEPETILARLEEALAPKDLAGRSVLITAGPTIERLDPVRFLSNGSTGKMGYALARVAALRGAHVTLVSGPVQLPCPPGVTRIQVESAAQMYEQALRAFPSCEVAIASAAVADFTPAQVAEHKIKKTGEVSTLTLVPTRDILKEMGARKEGRLLVGFAMETRDLVDSARAKLIAKRCDLLVANSLLEPGAGFAHDTNRVVVLDREGGVEALPLLSKTEVAGRILDRVAALLPPRGQA